MGTGDGGKRRDDGEGDSAFVIVERRPAVIRPNIFQS